MLHSHLPYVLNHGRWPHGSDWLCEAAVDTYLPFIVRLRQLEERRVATPLTIGVTPVLANQLMHAAFGEELDGYFAHRLAACESALSAPDGLDAAAREVALFWRGRFERLRDAWREIGRDIVGELRRLQDCGRLEITTSAATHGLLPLLARDESIRLQLAVGAAEYRRMFGRSARGIWLPECAYRPRGAWAPAADAPPASQRAGIEDFVRECGIDYFFADAHMARAGAPADMYGELAGRADYSPLFDDAEAARSLTTWQVQLSPASPNHVYKLRDDCRGASVAVLLRDPASSMRVWSRGSGYPGKGKYLEFHKISWPEGLRLWRVTDRDGSLGDKAPYDALVARFAARADAMDFVQMLASARVADDAASRVVATPFDTELFGHWWFEGVDFLGDVFEHLTSEPFVRPCTAESCVRKVPGAQTISLQEGSWGRDGDFSMWMNAGTEALWRVIWALEARFWHLAPAAIAEPSLHPLLSQCTRSLLLAQSSDWPFIITTGDAADYGRARFDGHARETDELLAALETRLAGNEPTAGDALARSLAERDALFPDVLDSVASALSLGDGNNSIR